MTRLMVYAGDQAQGRLTLSNGDLAIFFVLASLYSLIPALTTLVGQGPVILPVVGFCLLLYGSLRKWFACPLWRSLGWVVPSRGYWLAAVASGVALAIGVWLMALYSAKFVTASPPLHVALVAITLAPVFEESVFRGLLLPFLARFVGPVSAVLATCVLFALVHEPTSSIHWFCFAAAGCGYGAIRLRSGSTAAAALMHATYNLAIFVIQATR